MAMVVPMIGVGRSVVGKVLVESGSFNKTHELHAEADTQHRGLGAFLRELTQQECLALLSSGI